MCKENAGTPRHVIMTCPAMQPIMDRVRDMVESELQNLGSSDQWCWRADQWWRSEQNCGRGAHKGDLPQATIDRWPILAA